MASTYLTRTNSSAGSGTKFTISTWVKKGTNASGIPRIMEFYHSSSYYISLRFRDDSSNRLDFYSESNGAGVNLRTNRSFRDTSAWYHIVLAVDTTDATADDRMKMYINGVQETSFALRTNPSSSEDLGYNTSSATNYIGRKWENSDYFNGSMAHFHFIDGTAYDASTFGETDATTGIWKAKTAPSVTYGTNGFFLKFENSGSMGTDSSGNANNFTVNGTMTQTVDTPSNVFATLNSLINFGSGTFTNGNTTTTGSDDTVSTFGVSKGKWYWEAQRTNTTNQAHFGIGCSNGFYSATSIVTYGDYIYIRGDGTYASASRINGITSIGSNSGTPASFTTGDILSFSLDLDSATKNITIKKNNGATPLVDVDFSHDGSTPIFVYSRMNTGVGASFNFGNGYFGTVKVTSANSDTAGLGEFEYSVPDGYYSLCTKNINLLEYS
jgi:hypothetical protein